MIKASCPECGAPSDYVQAVWNIEATGRVSFTPTRDGIILSRDPIQVNFTKMDCMEYKCPHCDKTADVIDWQIIIICDSCGKEVPGVEYTCFDTKRIHCFNCWLKGDSNYCSTCTYRDACELVKVCMEQTRAEDED